MVGRWALLGGLTVVAFIASLPKQTNDLMILVSTAWIGATAFVLGVDCYTRAGLKEVIFDECTRLGIELTMAY